MNRTHLRIVKLGQDAIAEWRERKSDAQFDLVGADLIEVDLSKANLNKANLNKAHLSGANLSQANLIGAILIEANLEEANLGEADLRGANFRGANLRRANLSRANLRGANLSEVNLSSASLSEANLHGANRGRSDLRGAHLARANLSYARVRGANLETAHSFYTFWSFVDLSDALGLEAIVHSGPSSVGVETLSMSNGRIPEAFLRGCGLSDDFIAYIPSHFGDSAIQFYSCFISYSHKDKSFARRLHDALQGRGIRCWLDEKQILPGDPIHERIDEGIRLWDKVIVCASRTSLHDNDWWVDKELKKALAKEEQLSKQRGQKVHALIPLDLDGFLFSNDWHDWKRDELQSRHAPSFKGWETDNAIFEREFERVVAALRADEGARETPPEPKL